MSIIVGLAYYNSLQQKPKEGEAENNEHKTAEAVGKFVAAFALGGGFLALYFFSAVALLNMGGPFGNLGFTSQVAILGVVGGIDALTLLGLALRHFGFGVSQEAAKE